MTHAYVWHDSFVCVAWLIRMCDMTHSYVWHDSFVCVAWLIRMCDMTNWYVWHDSFVCVAWLIRMCGLTHSYVWHDSFVYLTWLIRMCDMTHSNVRHDSFVHVTWLIRTCDKIHALDCVKRLIRSFAVVTPPAYSSRHKSPHDKLTCDIFLTHMCDMTHSYVWPDSFVRLGEMPHSSICVTWFVLIILLLKPVTRYRAKTHRMPYVYKSFSAKEL